MKYKAGDRVRIKSLEWYNKNKTSFKGTNFVDCGNGSFTDNMIKYCGKVVTIDSVDPYEGCYFIKEDGAKDLWTDEMFECKVEEETKSNIIEEAKTYWDSIKDAWICPDGYLLLKSLTDDDIPDDKLSVFKVLQKPLLELFEKEES